MRSNKWLLRHAEVLEYLGVIHNFKDISLTYLLRIGLMVAILQSKVLHDILSNILNIKVFQID